VNVYAICKRLTLQKQIYNLLPFDEAALHDALSQRLKWGGIRGRTSLPHGPLLVMVVKPVGAGTVRLLINVESPSMPLLMSGSVSGNGAVWLGKFVVEVTVLVGKATVVVDREALPWRTSPLK
jgi:hypothetical protein